jgi:DNA-binding MarR family transcriptional regulator
MAAGAKGNRGKLPEKPPGGPAIDAWVKLAEAYHRIARRLEQALVPHGLTLAQFEVLARLQFDDTKNQNDLAQRLLVTKGNICGLIDRLETAGLVERRADPADRRSNRLVLTSAGRTLLAASLPDHLVIIQECLGALTPAEQRSFDRLAERVAVAADPSTPPTSC